tara:strand:+ start:4855 stop:6678 length:1824 start_codon:yes stop_codon:yes gene_type:complete
LRPHCSYLLPQTFLNRVQQTPHEICLIEYKSYQTRSISWKELYDESFKIARALQWVHPKKRIGILCEPSRYWTFLSLGIWGIKKEIISLSTSLSDRRLRTIINEAEIDILFTDQNLISVPNIIVIQIGSPEYHSFLHQGKQSKNFDPSVFHQNLISILPEDPFAICFTAGTTEKPKGVILSHESLVKHYEEIGKVWISETENIKIAMSFDDLGNIFGILHSLSFIAFQWKLGISSKKDLFQSTQKIQPSIIFAPPIIFNDFLKKIKEQQWFKNSPHYFQKLKKNAIHRIKDFIEKEERPFLENIFQKIQSQSNKLLLRSIFGKNFIFGISHGGFLSEETLLFYLSLGIPIIESYGMAETCGPITLSRPSEIIPGTCGRPLPDVEIRLSAQDEIWVRTRKIFQKYTNLNLNKESSFENEWYRTGDLGYLDPQGYLHLTERKENLITLKNGKKIAPQKIEKELTRIPLIEQAFVIGNNQPYLGALLTINTEELKIFAENNLLYYSEEKELFHHHLFIQWLQKKIDEFNQSYSHFEHIQKFQLVPENFSVEKNEITATGKLKRNVITRHYEEMIKALFSTEEKKEDIFSGQLPIHGVQSHEKKEPYSHTH